MENKSDFKAVAAPSPTAAPVTGWTTDEIIDQLNRGGNRWGSTWNATTEVTFSFTTSKPNETNYTTGSYAWEYTGYGQFNETQEDMARLALNSWSELANIEFTEVSGNDGDIRFSNSTTLDPASGAHAYYPGSGVGGDVWVNSASVGNLSPAFGNYGYMTLVHELGHAIGQPHPGDYNAGEGGVITYGGSATYAEDTRMYTVMSYFSASETGADHGGYYAQTPLLHDIMAIQAKYGANMDTRSGNTTYGFNSTENDTAYDFDFNAHPIICIWDGAGKDTINISGWDMDQMLDLRQGAFSDIGGLTKNLSIAYNAVIENAIGGDGNDTITGNATGNKLYGGRGNDVVIGGKGYDTLSGQDGNDTMSGDGGDDTMWGGNGNDTLSGGWGKDTLFGATGADNLYGNGGHDVLYGAGGDDVMNGGFGDDTLNGGDGGDLLKGGDGNDILQGGKGYDTLSGGNGTDNLSGDGGDDTIWGGADDDTLSGGWGKDTLFGATGADNLYGNGGHDVLYGAGGDDVMNGGLGNDALNGGGGADTFIFGRGYQADTIVDFKNDVDTIKFAGNLNTGGLSASDFIDQFAGVNGGHVVFDFGNGDTLTVRNIGNANLLNDDIMFG